LGDLDIVFGPGFYSTHLEYDLIGKMKQRSMYNTKNIHIKGRLVILLIIGGSYESWAVFSAKGSLMVLVEDCHSLCSQLGHLPLQQLAEPWLYKI